MQRTVTIKFDGQEYQATLPVDSNFTGSIYLSYHWLQGKLMKSEVQKSSVAKVNHDLSTDRQENEEEV